MATFLFVHGTFAKGAQWPELRAALIEAVKPDETAYFEEVTWSGRNRARARQVSADKIQTRVAQIRDAMPHEKVFIVGHSHGGSAVAYFLKRSSELTRAVSGYVFLSTPFVAIRPRRRLHGFFQTTTFLFCLFLIICWTGMFDPASVELFEVSAFSIGMWTLLLTAAILTVITSDKRLSLENVIDTSVKQQTADLPDGTYLFLRCSGDEAAAALSTAQFIAWISTQAAHWIAGIFSFINRPTNTVAGFSLKVLAGISIGIPAAVLVSGSTFGTPYFQQVEALTGFSDFLSKFVVVGIFAIPIVALGCLFAALLAFFLQAVTSWLFGWTDLKTGFLVELAIEPLPFGIHSLVHVDWNAGASGVGGITHSWTYAHPVAIKIVKAWVSARLAGHPMDEP
jgi:pimeloyl-ACP methyl ester carboxylesterase